MGHQRITREDAEKRLLAMGYSAAWVKRKLDQAETEGRPYSKRSPALQQEVAMPYPERERKKTVVIIVPESHVPSIRRWLKAAILDTTDHVIEDFLFDAHRKLGENR